MSEQTSGRPKIYHTIHIDHFSAAVKEGCLWSDKVMAQRHKPASDGVAAAHEKRLSCPVACHQGTVVADYVPFSFSPRSVKLFVIARDQHPGMSPQDGQRGILHLVADLAAVAEWANSTKRKWAFTDINPAHRAADFFSHLDDLERLNPDAITSRSWSLVRDHKMAEFLMQEKFPWRLVQGIGVCSQEIAIRVASILSAAPHSPAVRVTPDWYY